MSVDCTFNLGNALINLAGVALGGLIGFYSSNRTSNKVVRATACAKFRAAFAPAIARISIASESESVEIRTFFKTEVMVHAAAIEEFRPFVCNRDAYEKACNNYHGVINDFAYISSVNQADLEPATWLIKIVHKYGGLPKKGIPEFYAALTSVLKAMIQIAS
ncbi:MAG: hypothetical protein WB290_11405 [Smithella sp.]